MPERTAENTDHEDGSRRVDNVTHEVIRDRPHPKNLGVEEIRKEASELGTYYTDTEDFELKEAIEIRWRQMQDQLEERTGVEYPDCPTCGVDYSWGYEEGGWLLCFNCDQAPPDDVLGEVKAALAKLWGNDDGE